VFANEQGTRHPAIATCNAFQKTPTAQANVINNLRKRSHNLGCREVNPWSEG
jgi:hypothetical protein